MKKTLFLSAVFGFAALTAMPSMADNMVVIPTSDNPEDSLTASTSRLLFTPGEETTYAGTVNLQRSGGIWIGPDKGDHTDTTQQTVASVVHLTGNLTGSTAASWNEYSNANANANSILTLSGTASTYSSTLKIGHGSGGNSVSQISLMDGASLASATIDFEGKPKSILSLEGNATIAGLKSDDTQAVTSSTAATNTLTLAGNGSYTYRGTLGSETASYYGHTLDTALTSYTGTSLNITKTGTGTQLFAGVANIGTLTIQHGIVEIGNSASTIATVAMSNDGKLKANSGVTLALNTTSLTFGGNRIIGDDGTSEVANNGAFKSFFEGAIMANNGGKVQLTGNIKAVDKSINNTQTVTAGFNNLEVVGNVYINTYSHSGTGTTGNTTTWLLNDDKLAVTGDLSLTNFQYMTVTGASSSLTVGGHLNLGHQGNQTDGRYRGGLTVANGASATLHDIYFYGSGNTVTLGGTVTFTQAEGNLLAGNDNATANNTISISGATLKATDNSWTMTAGEKGTSVTLSGTNTFIIGDDKTITIGGATVAAGSTVAAGTGSGTGALVLKDSTLGSTLTANTAVTFGGSMTFTGNLTTQREHALESGNGYGTRDASAVVAAGTGTVTNDATAWMYSGVEGTYVDGVVTWNGVASDVYYVNKKTADDAITVIRDARLISSVEDFKGHIGLENGATLTIEGNSAIDLSNGTSGKGVWMGTGTSIIIENGSSLAVAGDITIAGVGESGALIEAAGPNNQIGTNGGDFHKDITLSHAAITVTSTVMRDYQVSGGSVTVDSHTSTTINSVLSSDTTLTVVDGSVATFAKDATVASVSGDGALSLGNHELTVAGNAAIGAITLGSGATITLNEHTGVLTTSSVTVAGAGATVNGDLHVTAGGTLDFSANQVLTMGCGVEIGDGAIVVIDGDLVEDIKSGTVVTLITNVDAEALTLGQNWVFRDAGGNVIGNGLRLDTVDLGEGKVSIVVAPEPATATLSLLALAGLMARRRRH